MRIACPSCEAAYEVPAPALAAGRKFRCARCHADWTPEIPGEAAFADDAPEPAGAPAAAFDSHPADPTPDGGIAAEHWPDPAAPPPLHGEPEARLVSEQAAAARAGAPASVVAGAWVASFAVLGAMGWGLVTGRAQVMQAWPPATRLYAAIGYLN